jgi:hypothetical protein
MIVRRLRHSEPMIEASCGIASICVALLCAPLLASKAQDQRAAPKVEIGASVRVSRTPVPYVEAHIAAHPQDPAKLVISASEVVSGKAIFGRAFYTADGGESWLASALPTGEVPALRDAYSTGGDTWVTYAPNGTALYSALAETKLGDMLALVYRSADGGEHWNGPAVIPSRTFDAPAMVAVMDGPRVRAYLAVLVNGADRLFATTGVNTAGVAVLRSDDGGASFAKVAFVSHDHLAHNALNPLVLPDATLLVPFDEYPVDPSVQHLTSSRIYVVRSEDGGQTFSLPYLVTEIPRMFPYRPRFAVDLSAGTFRGRTYVAWDGGRDDERNVSVAYSLDGGKAWTEPVAFRAADADAVYFSALAVNPNGTVGVAWLQHDRIRRQCYRIYFAASLDGARTFSPPRPVSDVVCPDSKQNRETTFPPDNSTVYGRWSRGGDYIGLAAAADGSFHPVWIDNRDGMFQVYTARIVVGRQ